MNPHQRASFGLKALFVWMTIFAVAMGFMALGWTNSPPWFLVGLFMFGANLLAPVLQPEARSRAAGPGEPLS